MRHGVDDSPQGPGKGGIDTQETTRIMLGYDSTAEARAGSDWCDLQIARTNHGSFFDQHLKGRKSPLLSGPSLDFPEVTFRRK